MKRTWTRVDRKAAIGTGLQGYLYIIYRHLWGVLGDPDQPDTSDKKTEWEWTIKFPDGMVVTFYNYKNGKQYLGEQKGLDALDIVRWHIGSNKRADRVLPRVQRMFPKNIAEYPNGERVVTRKTRKEDDACAA